MKKPALWQVGLILLFGVIAISSGSVLVRLAIDAAKTQGVGFSLFLAASRLCLVALFLIPRWEKLQRFPASPKAFACAVFAGACIAIHFATWILSLSFTSITASTVLVTTNPVWVSLITWLWWKQKPHRLVLLGIAVALGGVALIASGGSSSTSGSNPALGNSLALVAAVVWSFYLLLGREARQQGLGMGLYITISYTTAALLLFPLPILLGVNYLNHPMSVYGYVLLMAIFPQLIGHASFTCAVHWVSPTLVTLAMLFEPVGASFLAFLLFWEIPSIGVMFGGGLLLIGVSIAQLGPKIMRSS